MAAGDAFANYARRCGFVIRLTQSSECTDLPRSFSVDGALRDYGWCRPDGTATCRPLSRRGGRRRVFGAVRSSTTHGYSSASRARRRGHCRAVARPRPAADNARTICSRRAFVGYVAVSNHGARRDSWCAIACPGCSLSRVEVTGLSPFVWSASLFKRGDPSDHHQVVSGTHRPVVDDEFQSTLERHGPLVPLLRSGRFRNALYVQATRCRDRPIVAASRDLGPATKAAEVLFDTSARAPDGTTAASEALKSVRGRAKVITSPGRLFHDVEHTISTEPGPLMPPPCVVAADSMRSQGKSRSSLSRTKQWTVR